MTTNARKHVLENVLAQQTWPLFNGEKGRHLWQSGWDMAIVSLTSKTSVYPCDLNALLENCSKELSKLVFNNPNLSGYAVWVFPGTFWRPYNRITAHRKLWKQYSHFALQDAPKSREMEVRKGEQVRYFGGAQVSATNVFDATTLLSDYSFMLITQRIMDEATLHHVYDAAYSGPNAHKVTLVEWGDACLTLCPEGDIIVKKYADIDACEVGLDLFMDQKYIKWFAY